MATLLLKQIPDDVKAHILKVQGEKKIEKKVGQYSQDLAIYHIIREHKRLSEIEKK
jgi:hypothetical protein